MNLKWILLLSSGLYLSGCAKEQCLGEAGAVQRITRPLAAFQRIDVSDNVNVVLVQDSMETVEIVAPQYLEPNIATTIADGVLYLKNESSCTWLRRASETITAYVHLKKLNHLEYAGSGSVTSANTLITDAITINSQTGAGTINLALQATQVFAYIRDENADLMLRGTAAVCLSYTSSRGSIDFSNFVVKKMIIEYGGLRDATINVTDELDAILYYKGNLFYKGLPTITKNETHSTGRLLAAP